MYPSLPFLVRECTEPYRMPGSNLTIEKGTIVQIPIFAVQRDKKYYLKPNEFDPTRFLNESTKLFTDCPYFPFGDGPRNCIGLRLGKLQTKIALITMLKNFNFDLSEQHVGKDLVFARNTILLIPIDGIHLKVTTRQA